jgi:hypothetical protein
MSGSPPFGCTSPGVSSFGGMVGRFGGKGGQIPGNAKWAGGADFFGAAPLKCGGHMRARAPGDEGEWGWGRKAPPQRSPRENVRKLPMNDIERPGLGLIPAEKVSGARTDRWEELAGISWGRLKLRGTRGARGKELKGWLRLDAFPHPPGMNQHMGRPGGMALESAVLASVGLGSGQGRELAEAPPRPVD